MNSLGLIPACAGKTMLRGKQLQERSAHPRVCGENQRLGLTIGGKDGSSPRVRGKRALKANTVP